MVIRSQPASTHRGYDCIRVTSSVIESTCTYQHIEWSQIRWNWSFRCLIGITAFCPESTFSKTLKKSKSNFTPSLIRWVPIPAKHPLCMCVAKCACFCAYGMHTIVVARFPYFAAGLVDEVAAETQDDEADPILLSNYVWWAGDLEGRKTEDVLHMRDWHEFVVEMRILARVNWRLDSLECLRYWARASRTESGCNLRLQPMQCCSAERGMVVRQNFISYGQPHHSCWEPHKAWGTNLPPHAHHSDKQKFRRGNRQKQVQKRGFWWDCSSNRTDISQIGFPL